MDINKNDLFISNFFFKDKTSAILQTLDERVSELLDLDSFEKQMVSLQNGNFFETGFSEGGLSFVTESRNVTSRQRLLRQTIKNPHQSIYLSFRRAVKSAKKKIEIVSPYFILSKKDILLLENWLQLDSERTLEIYTTSLNSSDSLVVQAYFDAVVAPGLLRLRDRLSNPDRLKIYAYRGQSRAQILHTKLIAVDESRTLITSSNFDGRSKYMNSEVGLWVDDPALYVTIKENQIEQLRSLSDLYASSGWKQRRQSFKAQFKLLFQEYASHVLHFLGLENFL